MSDFTKPSLLDQMGEKLNKAVLSTATNDDIIKALLELKTTLVQVEHNTRVIPPIIDDITKPKIYGGNVSASGSGVISIIVGKPFYIIATSMIILQSQTIAFLLSLWYDNTQEVIELAVNPDQPTIINFSPTWDGYENKPLNIALKFPLNVSINWKATFFSSYKPVKKDNLLQ